MNALIAFLGVVFAIMTYATFFDPKYNDPISQAVYICCSLGMFVPLYFIWKKDKKSKTDQAVDGVTPRPLWLKVVIVVGIVVAVMAMIKVRQNYGR